MKEIKTILVDGRAQVKAALEAAECEVEYTVQQRYPASASEGVLVTYGEYSNVSTDCTVVDEIIYQVDVWAFDRETVYLVASAVNSAMLEMGLKRVYAGPDTIAGDSSGYLRKTYRFGRKVDKRTMRLVD